jgi:ribosomal-protein-alanine N-acetyltransferase
MSEAPARIQAAAATDLGILASLHAACFAEAWDADAFATLLAMPGAFALLAEEPQRETASGFLMIRGVGDEAEIIALAVDPSRQRRGLGRKLLITGIEEAAARGAGKLFLEVAADNVAALALYRSAGFAEVGRRADYYHRPNGAMAALVMAHSIALDGSDKPTIKH